jgi:hypothetical protein
MKIYWKMIIIFIFLNFTLSIIFSYEILTSEEIKNQFISVLNNKLLLKEIVQNTTKFRVCKSESGRFFYFEGNQLTSPLKDYEIDGVKFNENKFKWWIVFDKEKNLIILSSIVEGPFFPVFDEEKKYFILDYGTHIGRYLKFYDLFNSEISKSLFEISLCVSYHISNKDEKDFYFSNDNKLIAFLFLTKEIPVAELDGLYFFGIEIYDISKKKIVKKIYPKEKYGYLNIIGWDDNKILKYEERKIFYKTKIGIEKDIKIKDYNINLNKLIK